MSGGGSGGGGGGWSRVPPHRVVTVRGLQVIVDGFRYAGPHCSHYILTHFHADHYHGLSESFCHGLIHCSHITSSLLPTLGVPHRFICPHPYNEPFVLDGVQLTLIEANHCPGAVLILFQPLVSAVDGASTADADLGSPAKRRKVEDTSAPALLTPLLSGEGTLLHTGDFRWDEAMKSHPCLRHFRPETLYLDTTYSSPSFCFPLQSASISHLLHCLLPHLSSPTTLFLLSTYVIGKERIFHALIRALHCRLYVPPRKLRLLQLMRNPYLASFTCDPSATRFHVGGWAQLGETWPYFKANFRNADIYLHLANDGKLREQHAEEGGDDGLVDLPSPPRASSPEQPPTSLYDGEGGEDYGFVTEEHRRLAQQTATAYTAVVGFVPTGWVHNKSVAFPPPRRRKVDGSPFDGGIRRRSQREKAVEAEAKGIRKLLSLPTSAQEADGSPPLQDTEAPVEEAAEGGEEALGGEALAPHVVYLIPYSEHSSFAELQSCVKFFRPRVIVPTVFSDAKHCHKIVGLFRNAVDRTANVRSFLQQHFAGPTPAVDISAVGGQAEETPVMQEEQEERREEKAQPVEIISLDDDDVVEERRDQQTASPASTPSRLEFAFVFFCHECRHRWPSVTASATGAPVCPRCSSSFVEEQRDSGSALPTAPLSRSPSTVKVSGDAERPSPSSSPAVRVESSGKKAAGKQLSLASFFQRSA